MYPTLTVNLKKLGHNVDFLMKLCEKNGIRAAFVTKCVCADARIAALLEASKASMLADSRVKNLDALTTKKPKLLLRVCGPSEAEEAVRAAEYSLQSEISVIRALGAAAKAQEKKHGVILMADMGDLREGIFFKNENLLLETARAVINEPWLSLSGVGTNLTCYGSIVPDETNINGLVRLANLLRAELNEEIPIVSGGNSSTMGLLVEGKLPKGVNHLRLGEAFLLGHDTSRFEVVKGLYGDAFILHAELSEVQKKPSVPVGRRYKNAFGEVVSFPERGEMLRGILNIGRQDVPPEGLTALNKGIEVLGASSDHTIVNLTEAEQAFKVGDTLRFLPDYGALLRLFTCPYVEKEYL
ncbi:MAG TPA: alanine/ornithine racemase family PLP-dependent enzyme [Clostridia bacterium]|nr:alanine/ornithine racemase family PLP-dependent enzyme [Clostridia bacterium]